MEKGGEYQRIVSNSALSQRLDKFVSEVWGLCTRSQVKERFESALINGKSAKLSSMVELGDLVEITLRPLPEMDLSPKDLNLDVVFENDDVMVINKRAGLVVHPAAGNHEGTLVHGILFHLKDHAEQEFEDDTRPGIVHRLDKDTSGIMIIAKNQRALAFLAEQFAERRVKKEYVALGFGKSPLHAWQIGGFITRDPKDRKKFSYHKSEGKPASTNFELLGSSKPDSKMNAYHLVRALPKTGRTHQIRVHLLHSGLAIVGDPIYGRSRLPESETRLLLHAHKLEIVLPGHQEPSVFVASLPADFALALEEVGLSDQAQMFFS